MQGAEACGVTLPRIDAAEKIAWQGDAVFGAATDAVDPLV